MNHYLVIVDDSHHVDEERYIARAPDKETAAKEALRDHYGYNTHVTAYRLHVDDGEESEVTIDNIDMAEWKTSDHPELFGSEADLRAIQPGDGE